MKVIRPGLDDERFGKRLRELRHREGKMSLRELARRTGISPSYLSEIEQGKLPPPSFEKIKLLARTLHEDPEALAEYALMETHGLMEAIHDHPESVHVIAEALSTLPEEKYVRDMVPTTAQFVFSGEYGIRLAKPSEDELRQLADLVVRELKRMGGLEGE